MHSMQNKISAVNRFYLSLEDGGFALGPVRRNYLLWQVLRTRFLLGPDALEKRTPPRAPVFSSMEHGIGLIFEVPLPWL